METLKWIQQWFFEQCDGDWEHGYGIQFETLDNPGWSVKVSVENTNVQEKFFESITIERSEDDWIHCKTDYVQDRGDFCFLGYGGPENLEEILTVFKEWVEE
ncbi:immunity 53 family protein [Planococcus sp. S3-L1]|uniref:immunity 53 family protein n=1 Tax=Planococcus sp. S3-L1 TaxID=3046200 RepID=UPI0024BB7602|nr:immunity 53 family protein [Planococcus sp. S3-L1]MDJ0333558.1 immunity 53 family protein [Planococcus sp. S3-L1]